MDDAVAPLAGAWIEILAGRRRLHQSPVAPLAGAWIEIMCQILNGNMVESLPSRERGLKWEVNDSDWLT